MRKKLLYSLFVLILMIVFTMLPFPASDLCIRVHFDEIKGDHCALYYAADATDGFTGAQCISSAIDYDRKQAEFTLDSSLENHITGLRLDLPDEEQLLCIRSVTVSSAGVVKRQFNPCDFFAEHNILHSNGINSVSLAAAQARAYILTSPEDPYMILSPELCRQITDCYSHYRLTRLGICIFILGCCLFAHKNIFTEKLL